MSERKAKENGLIGVSEARASLIPNKAVETMEKTKVLLVILKIHSLILYRGAVNNLTRDSVSNLL